MCCISKVAIFFSDGTKEYCDDNWIMYIFTFPVVSLFSYAVR